MSLSFLTSVMVCSYGYGISYLFGNLHSLNLKSSGCIVVLMTFLTSYYRLCLGFLAADLLLVLGFKALSINPLFLDKYNMGEKIYLLRLWMRSRWSFFLSGMLVFGSFWRILAGKFGWVGVVLVVENIVVFKIFIHYN